MIADGYTVAVGDRLETGPLSPGSETPLSILVGENIRSAPRQGDGRPRKKDGAVRVRLKSLKEDAQGELSSAFTEADLTLQYWVVRDPQNDGDRAGQRREAAGRHSRLPNSSSREPEETTAVEPPLAGTMASAHSRPHGPVCRQSSLGVPFRPIGQPPTRRARLAGRRGPMASRTAVELKEWIKEHRITEVECLVPDMAGIPRGKILPAGKFLATIDSGTLRLPDSVFGQMVTGAHAETEQTTTSRPTWC